MAERGRPRSFDRQAVLERAMDRLCDRLECTAQERQEMKSALKGQVGQAAPAK